MPRKRLGELLLEKGVLTRPQLDVCLAAQKQTHQRLGVLLVQKGYITETLLFATLSEALGIPLVQLAQPPDWSAVHMLRPRFCEQNDLFPFGLNRTGERKQLLVAMADPLNASAIQQIEFTTGLSVGVRLASPSAIRQAILRYYHKGPGEPEVRAPNTLGDEEDEQEIVVGEELAPESALKEDLAFLFGAPVDTEAVKKLEKKFWALLRVLERKGLVTKEEFARELDESD